LVGLAPVYHCSRHQSKQISLAVGKTVCYGGFD
jgi:hypothetical protein